MKKAGRCAAKLSSRGTRARTRCSRILGDLRGDPVKILVKYFFTLPLYLATGKLPALLSGMPRTFVTKESALAPYSVAADATFTKTSGEHLILGISSGR